MTRPKILIAGGDTRQLYCADRLSRDFDIKLIGFDKEYSDLAAKLPVADSSDRGSFDYALLPVPSLGQDGYIYTPCYSSELTADTIDGFLSGDGIIYAGRADDRLRRMLPHREICDYLNREELNLRNAVPTAEGAVQLALEELPVTLNGLKVLIVGMGRIGCALAEILKGFGADITAAVHNPRGAAKARLHGISSVPTKRLRGDYGLIFNTAPKLIFDRELLSRFEPSALFIDLASKPGGIDLAAASELGIRAIWALGLPGKTAPVTSGEIIADTVSAMIAERGEDSE